MKNQPRIVSVATVNPEYKIGQEEVRGICENRVRRPSRIFREDASRIYECWNTQ